MTQSPRPAPPAKDDFTKHDQPGEFFNVHDDFAERHNYFAEKPELVRELKLLLEKYQADGRSTPGAKQQNDVPIGSTAKSTNPRTE